MSTYPTREVFPRYSKFPVVRVTPVLSTHINHVVTRVSTVIEQNYLSTEQNYFSYIILSKD